MNGASASPAPILSNRAALEAVIASLAAERLRVPRASVDARMPFTMMGLDSLGAIELTAALETRLGVEVPPDAIGECTDIRSLADYLHGRSNRAAPSRESDAVERMLADSRLPADVRPLLRRGEQQDRGLLGAQAILITGATGFLGARLTADLLERTNARLFCLVRPTRESPEDRLASHLGSRGIDRQTFAARVRIVEGDLSRPTLGISETELDTLARSADAVLHGAAEVNWVAGYRSIRAANVLATIELLRLACRRSLPFHFISSLSACYSTSGPRVASERFDGLAHLEGVHLGYAQTKIVAEALVREAGRRGLPVRIYRPSLIAGDSRTGAFNRDDLLSLMINGCVQMGVAPDLDWMLDCQPVDVVSRDLLALSAKRGTFHLMHPQPRHWRECLLWMRLHGYRIRLVSYPIWVRQLELETDSANPASASHPLRPLRSLFLNRPDGALTLPELYEETRRSKASALSTGRILARVSSPAPPLDATLLERYFAAFGEDGHLPPPVERSGPAPRAASLQFDESFFSRLLGGGTRVRRAELLSTGSDHSIVAELTASRTGRRSGLMRYRLWLDKPGRLVRRCVWIKIKPPDSDVAAVGEALAALCDGRVGETYARWRDRTGALGSCVREREIYRIRDPRIARHTPALLGSATDDVSGECLLVVEHISNATLLDSVHDTPVWQRQHLDSAIQGLAALHAVSYQKARELRRQPWIGFVHSTASMSEMTDLWSALADHAAPLFGAWSGRDLPGLHRRVVGSVGRWWQVLDDGPHALIHHDFNPRNICLRGRRFDLRLCAYDWELATVGVPQRDLAELLCFVLPADASDTEVSFWVERHRLALAREAGVYIDRHQWGEGFRAALADLLIDRLSMYALVHRVRRQPFLPRVLATWRRLYAQFPVADASP